jgi:transposase-like protein
MTERSIELVPNLARGRKSNGRGIYDKAAKRELLRRCLLPGVSLAGMALAHGLNANLLRKWVVQQTGQRVRANAAAQVSASSNLVPVRLQRSPVAAGNCDDGSCLELVLPGGTIRVRGRVDAQALRVVLDCLAARA